MERTVCFTGHRTVPLCIERGLRKALLEKLTELTDQGYNKYVNGGALGFDLMAAEVVLQIKEQNPEVLLLMVLPCKTQDSHWNLRDRERYRKILSMADEVQYVSDRYYSGCMLARNRRMIDISTLCVAYLTKRSGGSFFTVNYATKKGVRVINLAEESIL